MSELWQYRYCNICQSKIILMMCSIIFSKSNHNMSFTFVGLWNCNWFNKNSSSHPSIVSLSQTATKGNTGTSSVCSPLSCDKKKWKNGSLVHWDKNNLIIETKQNITITIIVIILMEMREIQEITLERKKWCTFLLLITSWASLSTFQTTPQFTYWVWLPMGWKISLASSSQLSWLCSLPVSCAPASCQRLGKRKFLT